MSSDYLELIGEVKSLVAGQAAQLDAIQKEVERLSQVATAIEGVRADLANWKTETVRTQADQQRQIDSLSHRVDRHTEIENTRSDLRRWMFPILVGCVLTLPSWMSAFHLY